jgi:hypothetical protein
MAPMPRWMDGPNLFQDLAIQVDMQFELFLLSNEETSKGLSFLHVSSSISMTRMNPMVQDFGYPFFQETFHSFLPEY